MPISVRIESTGEVLIFECKKAASKKLKIEIIKMNECILNKSSYKGMLFSRYYI